MWCTRSGKIIFSLVVAITTVSTNPRKRGALGWEQVSAHWPLTLYSIIFFSPLLCLSSAFKGQFFAMSLCWKLRLLQERGHMQPLFQWKWCSHKIFTDNFSSLVYFFLSIPLLQHHRHAHSTFWTVPCYAFLNANGYCRFPLGCFYLPLRSDFKSNSIRYLEE